MSPEQTPDTVRADLLADLVAQVADQSIIALDLQGTIVSWNAGAERLEGYTRDEVMGRSFAMFYTEGDRRSGLPGELLQRARDDGHGQHQGWRVRHDGTTFWADVTITALHDVESRPTGFAEVVRDLTEQHQLEVRLRESEQRLRLLVGQVVDYAIIALDPQGTIETWNKGAERLKGYREDEAIGRSFAMLYTQEDQRDGLPARLLQEARRQGRVEHTGWRVRRDGSRFWADVTLTALHDPQGRFTGYAKVTRDRTDVKRLEEAQDAFYATFTHDFRTPVTVIKGFVEALRDADGEERDELLDRVEAGTERLLSMVEGLVSFARQRVAHADLQLDDIDVAHVARSAARSLRTGPGEGRVAVSGDVALVRANGDAMHRVVTNLLVNALKYSGGQTDVVVDFVREGDEVGVRVRDSGRGIHPDDLATIFDQFERGRLATDDGGSGLGLASTRELVELQQGRVVIDSDLDVGTTVTVWLQRVGLGRQEEAQPAGHPRG
ncbi:sensor histidine kinase [Nocardioides aequoreus]|uniref:sensor histidine kinase n=1 Tax=Nocardioides aequoreus TaxID=397278 RepID=UPI00068EF336|nr:PAS domain-containing sensor histidine kinase [Nocardioides aequoreus]